MLANLFPRPKQFSRGPGGFRLSGPPAGALGELPARLPGGSFTTVAAEALPWAPAYPDSRPECYELRVSPAGVEARALSPEGLLRAEATLLQLQQAADGGVWLPACELRDWPDVRWRGASDWLLNCEINRWAYDWGDGQAAVAARLRRRLDFCAAHKINLVWFDGFGWRLERASDGPLSYAALARSCTRYARARGIRLTFAGYSGGYGTAYQTSELYRTGYQGTVFENRRPWPDGPPYACVGCDLEASRTLGTCLSNSALQDARIADLQAFVAAVEPGFVYLHDVDTGTWAASAHSWQWRCDECRRRWPSDALADPEGQAGAYAAWFRRLAEGLHAVRTPAYDASRELGVVLTSPLYTTFNEPGQPAVWEDEVRYFRLLSRLIGPHPELYFGVREQFQRADGGGRLAQLRAALEAEGCGHGLLVIAFGGGDNYHSDDLVNLSGALAPLYHGAQAVCLSNGGLHEEPVQVLNAEWLWDHASGTVPDGAAGTAALWPQLLRGAWRPPQLVGPEGRLGAVCRHLWGAEAGELLRRARLCGEGDAGPVSHLWWTVTREIRRLTGEHIPWNDRLPRDALAARWQRRAAATREALELARAAAMLCDEEEVAWFARCLEIGLPFAEALAALYADQAEPARAALARAEAALAAVGPTTPTDVLGGDPGCWRETLAALQALTAAPPAPAAAS